MRWMISSVTARTVIFFEFSLAAGATPAANYFLEGLLTLNGLPRKILGYQTPDEAFDVEMEKIFAA